MVKDIFGNEKNKQTGENPVVNDLPSTKKNIEDLKINNTQSTTDRIEFTLDPPTLVLNPNGEQLDKNPLCPECEQEIVAVVGHSERRFVCGCDTEWMFSFEEKERDVSHSSNIEKPDREDEWKPWEDLDE